jgi:hypothetical protein
LVELKILKGKEKEGLCVFQGKKSITIHSEDGTSILEVTNEYGNSVRYEISDNLRFNNLLANLWQFVKDSQH